MLLFGLWLILFIFFKVLEIRKDIYKVREDIEDLGADFLRYRIDSSGSQALNLKALLEITKNTRK